MEREQKLQVGTSWAVLTQLGRKHNVIWYGVKDKPHWSHTGK